MVPSVGGIGLEAVDAVGQQVPERLLVGGLGDPQRQADDGDVMEVSLPLPPFGRFFAPDVGGDPLRPRGREGRSRQRFGESRSVFPRQMSRDAGEVDIFEEQCLGQRPQDLFQPVGGLDDGDGIQTVFFQLAVGPDPVRFEVQHVGQNVADQIPRDGHEIGFRWNQGIVAGVIGRVAEFVERAAQPFGFSVKHGDAGGAARGEKAVQGFQAGPGRHRIGTETAAQGLARGLVHAHAAFGP